ncbi:CHRD domain-containing protein [Massilia phyllosphaerae]|uniref:CHRD domain-containing protein n=1 Tax=Massilia phyllosphaerae TaxID=3106034 RepID=UPI002B1CBD44|nr:CHRD domain-containing protein [Massilia sp. SGZ-792]
MKHVLSVLALAAGTALAAPAFAQSGTFRAVASGPAESPPNGSAGSSLVTIEVIGTQLTVDAPFQDLTGTTTMAHVHCCTADPFTGVAPVAVPFTGFPTGVRSGTYSATVSLDDAASYDPVFLAANGGTAQGAYSALVDAMLANEAYVNIHTAAYPNGEIRGFVVAAPIPEPAEWAMLGAGLAGLVWLGRRRRDEETLRLAV